MSPSFTGWLFWRWNTAITLPSTSRTVVGRASGCRAGSSTGVPCQPGAAPQMRGPTPTTTAPNSSAAASVTSASREIQVATRIATTLTAGSASFGSPSRPATLRAVTSTRRPFRFGVQLRGSGADAAGWVATARKLEDLGYATATMPDHFTDQLAPVPALSVAAATTTSLRVGALVFDNDHRHPVVLAKELATLDVLSGGRVEIGLGAGWMESDYRATGMPFDRAGVRIGRFEEAIAVIKGALADGPFSFAGEHYTITDYDGRPTPVQRPHPPLLIGGEAPRVLTIAA